MICSHFIITGYETLYAITVFVPANYSGCAV